MGNSQGVRTARPGTFVFSVLAVFALLATSPADAEKPVADVEQAGAVLLNPKVNDRNRIRTARRLIETSDPRVEDYLLRACRDSQNSPALRAALIELLPRLPRKQVVAGFLAERLDDEDEATEVRAASAKSLGALTHKESLALLRKHAQEGQVTIRLSTRLALLAFPAEAVDYGEVWLALLRDDEAPASLRAQAARQLGELRDKRARQGLIETLREQPIESTASDKPQFQLLGSSAKNNVPAAAARALGQLGDPSVVPDLLPLSESTDTELRIAVFEALAHLKGVEALPAAQQALVEDKELRVRRWAAVLLKELKDPKTLPALRHALKKDPDPGVRMQAVQALEAMHDREALPLIQAALPKEELKEVRAAMEQALTSLSAAETDGAGASEGNL
jgi:HEAT repeat protein